MPLSLETPERAPDPRSPIGSLAAEIEASDVPEHLPLRSAHPPGPGRGKPLGVGAWLWLSRLRLAVTPRPWLLAFALLVGSAVLMSAWGEYPLNDDWQYARAAAIFAATGHIEIDTPIAPSLVGQLLLAWPFIKLFGMSHLLLRLLTMGMACVLLWAADVLLRLADVPHSLRWKTLAVLVLNPWFACLALSFMTECYGYALAFLGAVVWLRSRRAADQKPSPAPLTFAAAALAAALIGASFWIRQYCVVAYPALVGATVANLIGMRQWRRLWRSLAPIVVGAVVVAAACKGYILWAKHHHVYKEAFSGPLSQLLHFTLVDYQVTIGLQLVYIGAGLSPLLLMWPWRGQQVSRLLGACVIALGFGLGGYTLLPFVTADDASALNLHRLFPFASNVINSNGIGPITLTDVFFDNNAHFAILSRDFWKIVTYVLVGLTALWGLPLAGLRGLWRRPARGRELVLFATALAAFSVVAFVQAMASASLDRYYFPVLLGAALAVPVLLGHAEDLCCGGKPRIGAAVVFAASMLAIGYFTVAGLHDYFRWNDARYRLVERATAAGVPTTSLDAGYEANGWLSFDRVHGPPDRLDESQCIGRCHCEIPWAMGGVWTCHDDSYRIGMKVMGDYVEIARDEPHFWLGKSPALILSRRPKPGRR